jgi:hypothetical protein
MGSSAAATPARLPARPQLGLGPRGYWCDLAANEVHDCRLGFLQLMRTKLETMLAEQTEINLQFISHSVDLLSHARPIYSTPAPVMQ